MLPRIVCDMRTNVKFSSDLKGDIPQMLLAGSGLGGLGTQSWTATVRYGMCMRANDPASWTLAVAAIYLCSHRAGCGFR